MQQNIRQTDILIELEQLCQTPGYIFVIAYLSFASNTNPVDAKYNLARNEIALLIRLMLKKELTITFNESLINNNIERTVELLSNLHTSLNDEMWTDKFTELAKYIQNDKKSDIQNLNDSYPDFKEPVFYAGDYAYDFQYRDFAVERYRNDNYWIIDNKGFDVVSARNIIHALKKIYTKKIAKLLELVAISQREMDLARILDCFSFTLEELTTESGSNSDIINKVLQAFSLSVPCSSKFEKIGDYNEAISHPIIPVTNNGYILFQVYNLAESFYQSPMFWMRKDTKYIEIANKNRGYFTENFAASCIERVLGKECIYKDVKIYDGNDVITDIDVLAIYADRAVIIQAKSKGLTELAKQGDIIKIKKDFQKAIQDAYNQGVKCAESLDKKNLLFKDSLGNNINVGREYREIFIICVTSEYYPSLNFQVHEFLQKQKTGTIHFPYIIDIFCLDTLCEMLNNPLYFFSFLNRRVTYDKKIMCENELAILADHLKNNLYFRDKDDTVLLIEDTQELDKAMTLRREFGDVNAMPKGILTAFHGTILGKIIDQISDKKIDEILDFGYVLLDNPNLINKISENIEKTMLSFNKDGKVHDFTVVFNELTFFIGNPTEDALKKMKYYCTIKKYQQKSDKWFGCFLSKEYTIEAIFIQENKWMYSEEMNQHLKKSPLRPRKMIVNQTGRNDPCLCGSGIKYKKCCLNKQ
jgi:hypothetical protein